MQSFDKRLERLESSIGDWITRRSNNLESLTDQMLRECPDISREEAAELLVPFLGKTREEGAEIAVKLLMQKTDVSRNVAINGLLPYIPDLRSYLKGQ
jgi:hypothetical protein